MNSAINNLNGEKWDADVTNTWSVGFVPQVEVFVDILSGFWPGGFLRLLLLSESLSIILYHKINFCGRTTCGPVLDVKVFIADQLLQYELLSQCALKLFEDGFAFQLQKDK